MLTEPLPTNKNRQESVQQRRKKGCFFPAASWRSSSFQTNRHGGHGQRRTREIHTSRPGQWPEPPPHGLPCFQEGVPIILGHPVLSTADQTASEGVLQALATPWPHAYTASDTNVLLTGTEVRTCHPDWRPSLPLPKQREETNWNPDAGGIARGKNRTEKLNDRFLGKQKQVRRLGIPFTGIAKPVQHKAKSRTCTAKSHLPLQNAWLSSLSFLL